MRILFFTFLSGRSGVWSATVKGPDRRTDHCYGCGKRHKTAHNFKHLFWTWSVDSITGSSSKWAYCESDFVVSPTEAQRASTVPARTEAIATAPAGSSLYTVRLQVCTKFKQAKPAVPKSSSSASPSPSPVPVGPTQAQPRGSRSGPGASTSTGTPEAETARATKRARPPVAVVHVTGSINGDARRLAVVYGYGCETRPNRAPCMCLVVVSPSCRFITDDCASLLSLHFMYVRVQ